MKKTLLFTFILIAFFAFNVHADSGVASITDLEGDVMVKKAADKDYQDAEVDMELSAGDQIATKEGAKAEIIFDDDNTILTLTENTTLVITKLNKTKNKTETLLDLLVGKILTVIKKSENYEIDYQVKTPTAIAAVKGTQFAVDASSKESYVGVFEGEVNVAGLDPTGAKMHDVPVKKDKEIRLKQYARIYAAESLRRSMKEFREKRLAVAVRNLKEYQELRKTGIWEKVVEARRAIKLRELGAWVKANPGWFDKLPAEKQEKIKKFIEDNKKLQNYKYDELRKKYPLLIEKYRQYQLQRYEKFKQLRSAIENNKKQGPASRPAKR